MVVTRIKTKDLLKIKVDLIKKQDNRCAICGIWFAEYPMKDICVDHDHTTGIIRGAVCRNCNRSEGKIKTLAVSSKRDDTYINWLGKLFMYWVHHKIDRTGLLHPTHKTVDEKKDIKHKKARAYYAKKKASINVNSGVASTKFIKDSGTVKGTQL